MEYLSEETQAKLTREGQEMTVLADDAIRSQFGADLDVYAGKNIESIFAIPSASPPELISKWDKYVQLDLNEFIYSDVDVNTFIRVASEQTEIAIKDAEAK